MRVTASGCAIVLATAVSDALGRPAASFYVLLVGVPVVAAAGLACLAEVVDGRRGRLHAVLAGLLLAAVVAGAAARSPVLGEGVVPRPASAALALAFLVLAAQAAALVRLRR